MKRIFLLSVTLLLLTQVNLFAQAKIGYINPDEIFGAMPEAKKADSAIGIFQQELSKTYQDQETELNAAIAKFVKDSVNMTAAMKDLTRKDLQDRIAALSTKEKQLNQALEAEKEKQLSPIRLKLLNAIKAVAKENGYGHVFYKEQAIVFPEADDLAALVRKKLGIK